MNSLSSSVVLTTLLLAPLLHAAKERPSESAVAPVLVAAADLSVTPVRFIPSGVDMAPTSAGVQPSLPDGPAVQQSALRVSHQMPMPATPEKQLRIAALPGDPNVITLVQASPLRGAAHMVRAERFNTDDGVRADDFAICYRLNQRSSIQVIPGDPAPVKMPVSSMANNSGVTVGMVMRLSKRP